MLRDLDEKLSRGIVDRRTLIEVCSLLKIYGSAIDTPGEKERERKSKEEERESKEEGEEIVEEESYSESKELLNEFFGHLKQLIKDNKLDIVTKGHVLHVIELRSKKWLVNNNYNLNQSESEDKERSGNSLVSANLVKKIQAPIAFPDDKKDQMMSTSKDDQLVTTTGDEINYSHVHPRDYVTEDFLIRNCDTSKGNQSNR